MRFRRNDKRHSKPNRLTIESLEQRDLMDGHGLDFEIPGEALEPGPPVELKGPAAPELRIVETSDNTVTLAYVDQ